MASVREVPVMRVVWHALLCGTEQENIWLNKRLYNAYHGWPHSRRATTWSIDALHFPGLPVK